MSDPMTTSELYTGGQYSELNPDWHVADSAWKCDRVEELVGDWPGLDSVCEVGCGAGEILRQLHDRRPSIGRLVGYEIAEIPYQMALERRTDRLSFVLGDAADDPETFDLMLIMDVIEHVPDPIGFRPRCGSRRGRRWCTSRSTCPRRACCGPAS